MCHRESELFASSYITEEAGYRSVDTFAAVLLCMPSPM
jgi:hypothetical protein